MERKHVRTLDTPIPGELVERDKHMAQSEPLEKDMVGNMEDSIHQSFRLHHTEGGLDNHRYLCILLYNSTQSYSYLLKHYTTGR